jgi:hypothetical protein
MHADRPPRHECTTTARVESSVDRRQPTGGEWGQRAELTAMRRCHVEMEQAMSEELIGRRE